MSYIDQFEKKLIGDDRSKCTIRAYIPTIKELYQFLGNKDTCDITLKDLDSYRQYLTRNHLEKSSKATKISAIRSYFNFLYEYGYIKENVALKFKRPKLDMGKPPVFLVKDEITERVANITGENSIRDKAIISIFISTGMRESELINLNLSDINDNEIVIRGGKGDKTRLVYMNQQAIDTLNDWLKIRPIVDFDAVFISKKKNRISTEQIYHVIEDRMGVSPHKLRHTFATMALSNGADIETVRAVLGHSSIQTTGKYLHCTNDRLKNMAIMTNW